MTSTQHDAYGEGLARISRHQSEAVTARLRLFEVLAAAGVPAAEADLLVSQLEAGAVAGAHTITARDGEHARPCVRARSRRSDRRRRLFQ